MGLNSFGQKMLIILWGRNLEGLKVEGPVMAQVHMCLENAIDSHH